MAVTQKDVAREAGVSQAVVSDVLQDRPQGRVSPETRARILETARRMGYEPNALARALRSRQSRQILYVVIQRKGERFGALGERVLSGMAEELAEGEYRLLIEPARSQEEALAALRKALAARVTDGCILRVFDETAIRWEAWKAVGCPLVVVGQCPDPEVTSIAHDAPALVQTALEHLAGRGHRRIGLIQGSRRGDYFRLIQDAWSRVAPGLGLVSDRWVAAATTRQEGERQVSFWLQGTESPTALVCLNERAAAGASQAVRQSNERLSNRVELLVVGSVTHSWLYEPGTWLLGTDLEEIGRRAGALLMEQLAGRASPGPVRLLPELRQL